MVVRCGGVTPTIHDANEVHHTTQYSNILAFLCTACKNMNFELKVNNVDISYSRVPKATSATFSFPGDEATDRGIPFALCQLSDWIENQGVAYFFEYFPPYKGECRLFVICELKDLNFPPEMLKCTGLTTEDQALRYACENRNLTVIHSLLEHFDP